MSTKKKLNFKQIACSIAFSPADDFADQLYGVTEDGVVYQYDKTLGGLGWHKLCMDDRTDS